MSGNPVMGYVKEVRETRSLEEVASLMKEGTWVCIACVPASDGSDYLFSLGRVC